MECFVYDGTGSPYDPLNYYLAPIGYQCPVPLIYLCKIRAFRQIINGTPRPIITAALQAEIAAAILSGVESANVELRPTQLP